LSIKTWWRKKSRPPKVVTVLATLLVLQIGLCWSTPLTVLPAYLAVFGHSSDSELGLGLEIWQGMLSIALFFLLALAILVSLGDRSKADEPDEEKNDR
jgi:heme A synthase